MSKKINLHGKLGKGRFALVDDEDFDYLNQWKWFPLRGRNTFYARRKISLKGRRCKVFLMHRVIMNPPLGKVVDHRDHDGLNNQRSNLRVCTYRQNSYNVVKFSGKSSDYKGVSFYKRHKNFMAYVDVNGKKIHLGYFKTAIEAARAYNEAALKYHGEFAVLNCLT